MNLFANIFGGLVAVESVEEYHGDKALVSLGDEWIAIVPLADLFIA